MTEKQVIRDVMGLRKWSQAMLAEKAGFKYQSNIGAILNRGDHGIRFDNLYRLLDAMDCEILVRDKTNPDRIWVINMDEDDPSSVTEELLRRGEITFEDAVKRGWRPSPEMLDRMLHS